MLDRVSAEMAEGIDTVAVVRLALRHADLSRVSRVREAVVAYARCG